jgi:hypothetical protein
MAQHEEGVGRTAVDSLLEQHGEATHRDVVRERSSNDGGGAFEGGKRQRGMREAGVGSDFRATVVPVWMMGAVVGVVPGEEQG